MDERTPWYRHRMVWLVIAGPALVIVAGFATLAVAVLNPDPVLRTVEMPAVQARNHAVTPK